MCVDVPADPAGQWTAKDHLAHSARWRERHGALLYAVSTGGELPPPDRHDEENAEIYQELRDTSLADIRDYSRSSWETFRAAVEASSEADLMKPNPQNPDELLWLTAFGTLYHTGEHLTYLYAEAEDEGRVEATHKWLHDVYSSVAPDDRQRGAADYNLACYYAKRGMADEAASLLRKGLMLRPDLVEWARQDTDLDPVRQDSRITQLLGAA